MKRKNSEDYKESVVKIMWNSTASSCKKCVLPNSNSSLIHFLDVEFAAARATRNAKQRSLQKYPTKRKASAVALTNEEYKTIIEMWDDNEPVGLQRKFFHVISRELAWRGGEGTMAKIEHFAKETDHQGNFTGKIEYNPVLTKTTQGGSKKLANSKCLIRSKGNLNECPVRLFEKYMEKRGNLQVDRIFVTPNPNWNEQFSKGWYKNCPIGKNTITSGLKESASKLGIDIKKTKVTNHSARATAMSSLAKNGVQEEQLIKITGHSNTHCIKSYLQMDAEHHQNIIEAMRKSRSLFKSFIVPSPQSLKFCSKNIVTYCHLNTNKQF
ncbi:hypothetical protein NQ315_002541 [Exocentrus adspersus]|uniref:Tyr recombinase domain-containing protein n=1 Tax=Exocentrus adspersus TaxID=1586481 RepID=A0AAV8VF82_9CUCU|nr:hypothetical protein NQ315_002541 [Exocentrus adspersus]